ncbi:MAG TPA: glutamine--fructose-6-phosphate aminotransferase, partial [Spirochaetaceae bacterium]|nr:glutamine--fructose-6-phosphate aminotransferase [Spirochaetaceae bacterium]
PVYPCNPGIFRSMYFNCLSSNDLIIGISQSGETKDLVDIFQDVKKASPSVRLVSIVNNENSRIPQELSDFYLPLLCGPEIAVAATKSFTSQIAILYLIAASFSMPEQRIRDNLLKAKDLMTETIETRMGDIETVAAHLFAAPSIHILGTGLIGLAREGALKIREVVLNHTEGYDAAEFKHGPNTILGRNTILSLADIEKLVGTEPIRGIGNELFEKLTNNYPLVFICPPEERDRRITISQIHTHKIRGADIVLIAEPQQELALAVEGKPMGAESYWSKYIPLPPSGDPCLFVFSATIVLQYLAYRMSVRKMEWLDSLGIQNHGV